MNTPPLRRGENRLLPRRLLLADGEPLPLASVASLTVELSGERGGVIASYTLGTDDELRPDAAAEDANGVILEITSALSATLQPGRLRERYTLRVTNAAYVAEPGARLDVMVLTDVVVVA